ncbi:MAG: DUF998 domain-containing protein [Promethearchaeota archaeon]
MKEIKKIYEFIKKNDLKIDLLYNKLKKTFYKELDLLYEKINGGFFALIAPLILIISIAIAHALYISVDPNFNVSSNWISDLGGGPNRSDLVFNSGMITVSFIMLFFQISLNRYLQKRNKKPLKTIKLAYFSGIIASIGFFFVGIFPLNRFQILHGIAADLIFFGGLFSCIFIGISEIKTPNVPRLHVIMVFIAASIFGLYILVAVGALFIPVITEEIVKFFEWVTLFVGLLWMFEYGFYTIMLSYSIIISRRGISLKKRKEIERNKKKLFSNKAK